MMKQLSLVLALSLGAVSLALFAADEPADTARPEPPPPVVEAPPVPAEEKPATPAAAVEDKPAKPAAAAEPDWYAVKPRAFSVTATLSGVFESQHMERVELSPEEWQTFKIVEVAPLGVRISEGDILIRFETDKIDRAIADAELSLQLAELNLAQNQHELASLEKTTPIDLASAERSYERAQQDHKRFVEIEFPQSLKAAELSLASSNQQLQYVQEELNQLRQMYKEDELTEQTEEIILKRQVWAVERAQFNQEQGRNNYEEATTLTLPRRKLDAEVSLERAELNWEKSKATLPLALELKRKGVERMVSDVQQAKQKLERLRADRAMMELRSPIEGIVYYGECVNGKWPSLASLSQSLRPGGNAKAGMTLFTVVTPRPLMVRSSVIERQLVRAPIGAAVKVTPTAFGNRVLTGAIRSVSPVPVSESGSHEVLIEVAGGQEAMEGLVPGMTCQVKVDAYRSDDALTVPAAALESDDAGQWRVKVRGEDGRAVERAVKLGWRGDDEVEVIEGLKAGDQVHPSPGKKADKSDGDDAKK